VGGSWLAEVCGASYDGALTGLLRVGPAGPAAGKLVRVRFLDPVYRGDVMSTGLRWEATGPAGSLFPMLDADITISPTEDQTPPQEKKTLPQSSNLPGWRWPGPTGRRWAGWEPDWTRRCCTGWPPPPCVPCCTASPRRSPARPLQARPRTAPARAGARFRRPGHPEKQTPPPSPFAVTFPVPLPDGTWDFVRVLSQADDSGADRWLLLRWYPELDA
jgi:hypothetical protein